MSISAVLSVTSSAMTSRQASFLLLATRRSVCVRWLRTSATTTQRSISSSDQLNITRRTLSFRGSPFSLSNCFISNHDFEYYFFKTYFSKNTKDPKNRLRLCAAFRLTENSLVFFCFLERYHCFEGYSRKESYSHLI